MKSGWTLSVVVAAGALVAVACGTGEDDPTMYLTGTESQALVTTLEDGGVAYSCPEKKALVCHAPPGNPANAHTLCVGQGAVNAHTRNHPDAVGACDGGVAVEEDEGEGEGEAGDETEVDAGTSQPEPAPEPEVDAGACLPLNAPCASMIDCCSFSCIEGVCVPQVN